MKLTILGPALLLNVCNTCLGLLLEFHKAWYLHCTTVNWMKKYFLKVVPRWNISPLSPGCYYIFSVYSGSTWIKMDRWSRAAVLVFHHPRTVLALMRCSNLWCWYRGNGQIRPEGGPCPQASNTPLILLLHLLRSDQNACSEWQRGWLGVFTVSRKSGGKRHRRSLKGNTCVWLPQGKHCRRHETSLGSQLLNDKATSSPYPSGCFGPWLQESMKSSSTSQFTQQENLISSATFLCSECITCHPQHAMIGTIQWSNYP